MNVLIAEDNAINQMVVKHTLQKLGATAVIANNGLEAIELLQSAHFDLILMDIQMPFKDGYETTCFIRNELQSQLPIIAMTAFAQKGEQQKCIDCGMNAYVSKPFTVEGLNNTIQSVLASPVAVHKSPHVLCNHNISIDLGLLYEISGNDEAFIKTMIQTFLENLPETFQKIETNIHANKWDEVSRSAHYAKSSLSVVKVRDLYDDMLQLETDARHKSNLAAIPNMFKRSQQKLQQVVHLLSENYNLNVQTV